MKENFNEVLRAVRKGKVHSAYFLYGEEDFRLERSLDMLLDALVPERDRALNLVILDGALATWDDVLEHLRTSSMFGGRKVVVVKDARLGASHKDAFAKAKNAWREGSEAKQRRAAALMMGILGDLDWPLEALADGGPEARSIADWKKDAKLDISDGDFEWMGQLLEFARERGMAPTKSDDTARLEQFVRQSNPSDAVLVLAANSANTGSALYKTVAASGAVVGFNTPKGERLQRASLEGEIGKMLKKAGKKMEPQAIRRLELKTGFDLRRATGEMEKLLIFVGDGDVIRAEDVEAVVPRTKEESVFELTDAFMRRDSAKVLRLLDDLIEDGHHPLELLAITHNQLRNLFLATGYAARLQKQNSWNPRMSYGEFQKRAWPEIKKAKSDNGGEKKKKVKRKTRGERFAELANSPDALFPRLHPFVAYNAMRYQASFELGELMRAFRLMKAVDERIKRSAGDPVFLLEQALVAICKNRPTFLDR